MKRITLCLVGILVGILVGLLVLSGCVSAKDFYGLELIDNPKAQDVSSVELIAFLEQDKTNEHEIISYIGGRGYMCVNFSVDLHNNAEEAMIRCAIVTNATHAFNAFNTTDKGLVYVDASTGIDSLAYLEDSLLIVPVKIREGIGVSATGILGDPNKFKLEW